MRNCFAVCLLLSVFPLFAQTKHPFTFEDMMALKRVEEPVVSPDGKWVLFAAVDVDLKADTKTPHVWVVPLSVGTADPSTARKRSQANPSASLGMTREGVAHTRPTLASAGEQDGKAGSSSHSLVGMTESKEREIISDQDADRPRWAPDGKRFAFVSTKENGSQIWIADFDATTGKVTAKHRVTSIPTEADGELWSADGKYILFKSDVHPECVGTAAQEATCNAKKVEEVKESKVKVQIFTHLLYRHWNAYKEGKRTHLFVVAAEGIDANRRAGSSTPPDHSRANDPTPVGMTESKKTEVTLDRLARDLTPGDYDAPVFSMGGQDDYAFSPDGKEICYASNHDAMPAASTNNDLFTVPVDWPASATSDQVLAATKNITAENEAADNTPLYSPDGKYIAYRAQQRPGYESDRFRLMLYDRKTAEKKSFTEGFDKWVGTFTWSPDSRVIYLSSEETGRSPIRRLDISEPGGLPYLGSFSALGGYVDDVVVTKDGRTLLSTHMTLARPVELLATPVALSATETATASRGFEHDCIEPLTTKGPEEYCDGTRRITHVNDSVLSRVSMSPLEPFRFTGAHNDKVEGFLVKPPNFDPSKKYPVKFLIHGGPEGAWGDDWSYRWNPELFAANGYVVIMINFHGSTGYGQKFIDAINGDWGGAPFEDLMKGLDYAEQHYAFIDKDRECALGASYGGWMANWILGHTNRFKCIVTHDGMFNTESAYGDTEELWFPEWEFKGTPWTNREMYRKWSPHLSAANFKTPTLVIHGQLDYRLDVSQGFDLFTTLQRQGVPSKMLYFPDEGHWVLKPQNSQLWYKTVNDWVDQWTRPVAGGQ